MRVTKNTGRAKSRPSCHLHELERVHVCGSKRLEMGLKCNRNEMKVDEYEVRVSSVLKVECEVKGA